MIPLGTSMSLTDTRQVYNLLTEQKSMENLHDQYQQLIFVKGYPQCDPETL